MSESLIDEDMEIIKDSKPLKFGRDFARYGFVGVVFTFINIFLMWLLIDVLKAGTIIGASLTVIFIFFTKYYAYVVIGFMARGFTNTRPSRASWRSPMSP